MRLAAALVLACAAAGAAAENAAAPIAARALHARAAELRANAQAEVADEIEAVAAGLDAGSVTLGEAQQVMEIIARARALPALPLPLAAPPVVARPPTPPRPATPPPAAPVNADQVAGMLDGTPPANSGEAAKQVPAEASPAVATTILALQKGEDGKPAKLMVGAGTEQGVAIGDRFAIRKDGATKVVVKVTMAKDTMAVCVLQPESWLDGRTEIHEGDAAVLLAR